MGCSSGKTSFLTIELAEEALIDIRVRNNYAIHSGPINIYLCHNCDCYHFTSKGERHPMLNDSKVLEKIKQGSVALDWEKKFHGR